MRWLIRAMTLPLLIAVDPLGMSAWIENLCAPRGGRWRLIHRPVQPAGGDRGHSLAYHSDGRLGRARCRGPNTIAPVWDRTIARAG